MKLIYIDTETTGINPETAAITQLAGVIRIGDMEESFNIFMAPHEGAEVSDEALAVQGKTREEIQAYQSPKLGYVQFCSILGKYVDKFEKSDKFFLFGYNVRFDEDMIRSWFKRQGDNYFGSWFWYPSIDIMTIAMRALIAVRHTLPNFKLETVYKHLFPDSQDIAFHDARDDIAATRRIARVLGVTMVPEKKETADATGKN